MKQQYIKPLVLCLVSLVVVQMSCTLSSSQKEPAQPEPASSMTWKLVGTGDCTGYDDPETTDGSLPDDSRAKAGYTAVCWDAVTYNNKLNPGKAFCTYKKIAYTSCKGGDNTGEMYTAVANE
jgi:hypothetical protein